MATMIAGSKRMCALEELLLLDPHLAKRCRLDGRIPGFDDDSAAGCEQAAAALASAASASIAASTPGGAVGSGLRRQHDLDDESELDAGPAAVKRLRQMVADVASGDGASSASSATPPHGPGGVGDCDGEAPAPSVVEAWAEVLVRDLQDCPSREEALQRCRKALGDFREDVRGAVLRELETRPDSEPRAAGDDRGSDENDQGAQHTNGVLRRAVYHLMERCRRLESEPVVQEMATLRQALEQSQETQHRLARSNEVLQSHLRLHIDGCLVEA
mmetsp:Transcript_83492/g.232950  ORF Transcript_83492/g.232950 Transcript_83492/m.232950 type:complete len:273 (-) Transcript_83492:85-903(-)